MTTSTRKIITLEQVSEMTGITLATLRSYRATGKGPKTFKLGGKVVALESDIEAWIQAAYEEAIGD